MTTSIGQPGTTRTRWVNILPIAFVAYTISYFDRTNLGVALPAISKEFGLTPLQGGGLGGALSWGYFSTQLLAGWFILRIGARNVVGWALVLWGAAAVGTGLTRSFEELLAARVLLGMFEGPVFAAMTVILADWFTRPERGRAFGIWNLSSPVGTFLAGPISGMILAHDSWRAMMVVEGLPAWIWAVLWWWRIPPSLEAARWLPAPERDAVARTLAEEQAVLAEPVPTPWWTVLSEPVVWLSFGGFALIGFLISGFTVWLPSLLTASADLSVSEVGWLSGLPYLAGIAGLYLNAHHSDWHGQERRWHAAVPTMLAGASLIGAILLKQSFAAEVALLVFAGFTMKAYLPLVYAQLTEVLPKTKAMPAVVAVNTTGNLLAGVFGPLMIGYVRQVTGSYDLAFIVLGATGVVSGLLFAAIRTRARAARVVVAA